MSREGFSNFSPTPTACKVIAWITFIHYLLLLLHEARLMPFDEDVRKLKKKKETTLLFVKHFPAVYGKFCGYCARADERPWQLQSFMLSSQYKKIFSYRWLVAIFRNCTMGSVKWVEMGKEIGPRQRERLWRTKEGLLWQKKKKNNPRAVVKRTIKFSFYGNLTLATQGKQWDFERLISRVREWNDICKRNLLNMK